MFFTSYLIVKHFKTSSILAQGERIVMCNPKPSSATSFVSHLLNSKKISNRDQANQELHRWPTTSEVIASHKKEFPKFSYSIFKIYSFTSSCI